RNHATVDTSASTRVTDFRVNHVSEVDGCGAARQLNHLAHGRECVNVLRVEVQLERVEEVLRVFDFLSPLDERSQGLQRLIGVARAACACLLSPVCSGTCLGPWAYCIGPDPRLTRLRGGSD